jgi:hypothetical protein
MTELPPIPQGFMLADQGLPPLPEGFVMADQQTAPAAESSSERGVIDKLTGQTGERYQLWPERLARGVGKSISSAATLPGDVMAGQVNPEEATGRVMDLAMAASPINPAFKAGSRFGAPAIPREAIPSGQSAAVTAAELGAPLPMGVASDSRTVQAITQASRQMPFVGQKIEEKTAATIGQAGEKVGDLATSLGASPDRATFGADLRTTLGDVVSRNKETINESYKGVRSLIDSKAVAVPENTKKVFEQIIARRAEAGQPNPTAGLEQIENIVTKGVNFDGMIRAKSDLASTVDFLAAHGGFSNADKKQLGAAMSRDLGEIAAKATQPGLKPEQVVAALRGAESEASKIINSNKTVGKVLANKRDEGLANSVLSAAGERGGNLRLLGELKTQLSKEDFESVAGTALAELGHNPATGQFSLNKFATSWEKLNPRARELMFPKGHGRFLNDIAELGKHLKGGEQYMNTSGTGRAAMLGGIVATAGTAAVAAVMGNYAPILGLGASVAGGYALAKGLARPAVAASMARVSRAALAYEKAPSFSTRSTLMLASKDAVTNLASANNVSPAEFLRLLKAPATDADQHNRPASFDERFQGQPPPPVSPSGW